MTAGILRLLITFFLLCLADFQVAAQSGPSLLMLAKSEVQARQHGQKSILQPASANGQNIDVIQYRAHWWLNPASDSIRGKVAVVFRPASQAVSQTSLDLASNMVVESVKFRNVPVQFSFAGTSTLNLNFGNQQLNPGSTDSLVIRYRGKPVPSAFGSFTRTQHGNAWLVYTLSEPYGAKDWWPCKQSLTDKADSTDITIYTTSGNTAVSNGILVSQSESVGIRTFRWKHKYPIATYLIAIASTNYAFFRHKAVISSGDTLPVDNYCYPENKAQWQAEMLPVTRMIRDFDSLLAPYPFAREKYGHTQFAFGGGMEHQTNSFMQNTDFGLQAHELAHQWFGDKITCHSWTDIWLNEGFATYLAAMEYVNGGFSTWPKEGIQWIDYICSEPDGSVFCSDTSDLYRIFSGRLSYAKGAMLLRMLRWKIGDNAFWQGIRSYISDASLAYSFTSTAKFRTHMESSSGQDLSEFFADWHKGQGYPQVQVDAMISSDSVQVTFYQQPSHNSVSFFEMDVPLRIKGGSQDSLFRLPFTENGQTFKLKPGFIIDSIQADPLHQWLARWNVSQVTSAKSFSKLHGAGFVPNPFSSELKFIKGGETIREATLFRTDGTELFRLWQPEDGVRVATEALPAGCYLLRLTTEHEVFFKKILKK